MKYFLAGLVLVSSLALAQTKLGASLASSAAPSAVVVTPHVRAELMADAPEGVQVGKSFYVGLQLQHQPQWHTYWKNAGDSGLPTRLTWTLPAGIVAGKIQWPVPKKIPVGNLANYGYEGSVLLSVPLTVQAALPESQTHVDIRLRAEWLVCKTECIPEEGEFLLQLPVRGATAANRALFESTKNALPKGHPESARFEAQNQTLKLSLQQLPAAWQGKSLEAFPEESDIIETAARPAQSWNNGVWTAQMPLSNLRSQSPQTLQWLIKIAGGQGNPAVTVRTELSGAWPSPPVQAVQGISPALADALAANQNSNQTHSKSPVLNSWFSGSFWLAALGALLGGLILNLMPCVLPILAIKLLSFAPASRKDLTTSVAIVQIEDNQSPVVYSDTTLSLRASSGLFAAGIIATFVLLALIFLLLRSAGTSLGWGFQLQSPPVVLGLATLFLLIGLNLFDAFHINTLLPNRLTNLHFRSSRLEALLSGCLAVLVATPCTAPFMGASLGLAIGLPAGQALLIFTALGLGMALPFIALMLFPSLSAWLLKALPKPGAWMDDLRRLLAWPVFATTLWLLWVYALQTAIEQAFMAAFALLMIIALLWSLHLKAGRFRTLATVLLLICFFASLTRLTFSSAVPHENTTAASPTFTSPTFAWQDWSPEAQAKALSSGRPVFVDFTAAWCITCQVNKSTTLNASSVLALMQAKQVVMLRADWTRPNPAIAQELNRLGRSGLPVYVLYLPGAKQPQILPEILTPALLQQYLSVL